ncbi:hypothetical protein ACPA54_09540 [Uniformispora flossi]|uniref:hypothetical protein n=1 Tax=Uniformispora flossi TaxID=3390723 RepID=UPI003C2E19F9
MALRRTGIPVALGIVVAVAGFGPVAPPAYAAAVSTTVECDPPMGNGGKFTWQPQIELSVAPQKSAYAVGDKLTVTWHWKTPPRNPSSWVLAGKDLAKPSGTVKLTGTQTGDVAVIGPQQNPATWGAQPLAVADMTGTLTVAKAGKIDLAPAGYVIENKWLGRPTPCVPTTPAAVALSLQVADTPGSTPTPGQSPSPGASASGTPGASVSPGATGTPGATGDPTGLPSGLPTAGASGFPIGGDGGSPAGGDQPPAEPKTPPPPGPLIMQIQDGVTMAPFAPGGGPQFVQGELKPVTVVDGRNSTLGWTLTGQIDDFVAIDGSRIPADRVTVVPNCAPTVTSPSAVMGGLPGTAAGYPELLCRQNPSMGELTGGKFRVGASLNLAVPEGTPAGDYTAEMTLTLI